MKGETFIIRKEADIHACAAWLLAHLANGTLEVTAAAETRRRSINQNRLLWLWNTEIANHMGLYKDEVHEMLKRKFAVPIFTRDDPNYAEMVAAVKSIRKQGMGDYAESLAREISRLTSTTDFSVNQMSEYLGDIEHYAAEIGAELTFPEELYSSR